MRNVSLKLFLALCWLGLFVTAHTAKAQSTDSRQLLDYYELKGLLTKHKTTIGSQLSMKRFTLVTSKDQSESTIDIYEKGATRVLVRIRKSDGLASEIAWKEKVSTLGNLTHDAVDDGFVPVAGNSRYYNRFQKMALWVSYALAEKDTVPCLLKAAD